jgi:hypothetical protein
MYVYGQLLQVRFLNPLEIASRSKLLVTTRIRGLVKQAAEVPLELLKIDESADLLMEIGEINQHEYQLVHPTSTWAPDPALKIAQECGNLPLTVTLVGKLIRDWGALWDKPDSGVLSLLQKRRVGTVLGADTGTSLEQSIIQTSLNALTGDEAKYVKDLFYCLAVSENL